LVVTITPIEAIQFLHQAVAVLVDGGGAGLAGRYTLGEQAVSFIGEQHCVVDAGSGKGSFDVQTWPRLRCG
jgi:hypothetical protein